MKVYAWLTDFAHCRENCPTGIIPEWMQKVTRHNGDNTVLLPFSGADLPETIADGEEFGKDVTIRERFTLFPVKKKKKKVPPSSSIKLDSPVNDTELKCLRSPVHGQKEEAISEDDFEVVA